MRLLSAIFLFINFGFLLFSDAGIKLEKTIKLSENNILIQAPSYFSVTEDETFLISDFKSGDVKVFDSNGNFIKKIGRKGYGPNELAKPHTSFYKNKTFYINDRGQNKIFLYQCDSNNVFKRINAINCNDGIDDMTVIGNIIFFSGCKIDKSREYNCLYSINVMNQKYKKFYMKSYKKFGLNSNSEFKRKAFKEYDLSVIGRKGIFEIYNNFAYYVWEGDLKVFKINLTTKKIETFGFKSNKYIKPISNNKLKNALLGMKIKDLSELRDEMSYVRNMKITNEHIMLFYNIPCKRKNNETLSYMLQFYTFDGKFIKEIPFKNFPDSINISANKQSLYAYKIDTDEDLDLHHYILKYKILE